MRAMTLLAAMTLGAILCGCRHQPPTAPPPPRAGTTAYDTSTGGWDAYDVKTRVLKDGGVVYRGVDMAPWEQDAPAAAEP